jgi:hypothetical protein
MLASIVDYLISLLYCGKWTLTDLFGERKRNLPAVDSVHPETGQLGRDQGVPKILPQA